MAPASTELYVAVQSFHTRMADGSTTAVFEGQEFPGSHELVKKSPQNFAPVSGGHEAVYAAKTAIDAEMGAAAEHRNPSVPHPPGRDAPPPRTKMRAVRNARVGHAAVMSGDEYSADDSVVKQAPAGLFFEVTY